MDCYYHPAVPSIDRCAQCHEAICATCRSLSGTCPDCRLATRIEFGEDARRQPGRRARPTATASAPRWAYGYGAGAAAGVAVADVPSAAAIPVETRGMLALGYALWPLALLALLLNSRSRFVRRQAAQALIFNVAFTIVHFALIAFAVIPVLGIPAAPLLACLWPIRIILCLIYGLRTWRGKEVRVPFVSAFLDERLPA